MSTVLRVQIRNADLELADGSCRKVTALPAQLAKDRVGDVTRDGSTDSFSATDSGPDFSFPLISVSVLIRMRIVAASRAAAWSGVNAAPGNREPGIGCSRFRCDRRQAGTALRHILDR